MKEKKKRKVISSIKINIEIFRKQELIMIIEIYAYTKYFTLQSK